MDRLFLDANVLFSAAYRADSGLSRFWQLKRVTLLTSPYALEEAERNLLDSAQRSRLRSLARSVEMVRTMSSEELRVDLPAKDEPILRSAIAGHATHLITGDTRHFGKFFGRKLAGVIILRPAQYLSSRY